MNPDHLLNLADSPNYRIYCLLPPASNSQKSSMSIICALLVKHDLFSLKTYLRGFINYTKLQIVENRNIEKSHFLEYFLFT